MKKNTYEKKSHVPGPQNVQANGVIYLGIYSLDLLF
jgi:hypothetical protein